MPEKFSNNAQDTLNGAINNSVTSLIVHSATLFPSAGNFRIVIDSEIMLVTAVASTTFTVTRGAEGTTAASHSDGATVRHVLTAGSEAQGAADAAGGVAWTLVTKPSDQDVTSSTTLADDNDLKTPALTSGKMYEFEICILAKNPSGTGGNLKLAVGEDSTNRGVYGGQGISTGGNAAGTTSAVNLGATQSYLTVSTATEAVSLKGSFISAGGAFKLQWAQVSSSSNAVRVAAGSLLRYRQIN